MGNQIQLKLGCHDLIDRNFCAMFKVVIFCVGEVLLVCKNNFEKHFEKKHFSNLKYHFFHQKNFIM
jgi:hypothetical protein